MFVELPPVVLPVLVFPFVLSLAVDPVRSAKLNPLELFPTNPFLLETMPVLRDLGASQPGRSKVALKTAAMIFRLFFIGMALIKLKVTLNMGPKSLQAA